MNTTTAHITHTSPQSTTPRAIAPRRAGCASPARPTWGGMLVETASIIGVPAFFGPPIIFLLAPWLALVLLLIGPLALIFTVVLAMAVAAALLAGLAAVIASPYLLIRHLRAHGMVHARPRVPLHPFRKHGVSLGWAGSLQPKGVS